LLSDKLLGDIISIAAYTLCVALIESVLTTAFVTLLAFLLPGFLLRDGFAYKGAFAILAATLISIHLQLVMNNQPQVGFLVGELALGLALWLVPVLLTHFIPAVRKVVLDILDRMTIFSFIYVPLGLVSLAVVIARNLW
jgi:hypothetical protein